MERLKLDLVIERSEGELTGRVTFNENLIFDFAPNVEQLEAQIKKLLSDFEGVNPDAVEFTHYYDVYALFERFDFLNISKVAKHAEMNPALLRQYASGVKNPSAAQAIKIENTIHQLAAQMQSVAVYAQ